MLSLKALFKKETRYGDGNLYKINVPSLRVSCFIVKYENHFLSLTGFPKDTHDFVVDLETRVSQDLFNCSSFSNPYIETLHVKIPTRYSHIIIPMTDSEHRRITSGQLSPGAKIDIEIQPKTAWELDGHCGVSWTALCICKIV
jgi:hypothetical protein